MTRFLKGSLAATVAGFVMMAAAHAVPITVTIKNNSTTNGLSLTPLFVAFHNGAFDAFNVGGFASAGVERVAEVGLIDLAIAEALGADGNAVTGGIGAAGGFPGAPVIEPGETGTMTFDLDPSMHRFLTYLSMVIPSNDTFIGNDNALEIFDIAGNFIPRSFDITGDRIWDAGTEENDLTNGPAFVAGQDGNAGTVTNNEITLSDGIGVLAVALPNGSVLNPVLADFTTNRSAFSLATITISADPVPLPAALPLMAAGLAGGAWLRRRRKATT